MLAILTLTAAGSTYQQLVTGSARIRAVGATIEAELAGRQVSAVRWRTLEAPPTAFYVLRAKASPSDRVGDDLWPYLMDDLSQRPPVEALPEGDLAAMRDAAPRYEDAGELLVVIDRDYALRLLAYEGEVLIDAGEVPPDG